MFIYRSRYPGTEIDKDKGDDIDRVTHGLLMDDRRTYYRRLTMYTHVGDKSRTVRIKCQFVKSFLPR